MSDSGTPPPVDYRSVAEEIAALAAALRTRGAAAYTAAPVPPQDRDGRGQAEDLRPDSGPQPDPADAADPGAEHSHPPGMDACEVCPVCRAIAALHTVSPSAVLALADLVHQAEVTLRALASDMQSRQAHGEAPTREDIPVDDLGHD